MLCAESGPPMKYPISFRAGDGVTVRSEVMLFQSDEEALAYGKAEASKSAIVEVWKGDDLLIRLDQSKTTGARGIAARQHEGGLARKIEPAVL